MSIKLIFFNLYMDKDYYNKYIKYKFKYSNLFNQTGGDFKIINRVNNTITFEKDSLDKIIILEGIIGIVPEIKDNDGQILKNYFLKHSNYKFYKTNLDKLNEYYKNTDIIINGIDESSGIQLSGTNFEILYDLVSNNNGRDPNNALIFINNNRAILQEEGFKKFIKNELESNDELYNRFYFKPYTSDDIQQSTSYGIILDSLTNEKHPWNNFKQISQLYIPTDNKNLEYVIRHQKLRFRELAFILDNYPDINVIIAGENIGDGWKHTLGTGLAKGPGWWNDSPLYYKMLDNITELVDYFRIKYNDRVSFGFVGDNDTIQSREKSNEKFKGKPKKNLIHVWGANSSNYNFVKDHVKNPNFGGGQALYFNQQKIGIFGIITTNMTNHGATGVEPSLNKSEYLLGYYPNLVDSFYNVQTLDKKK